MTGEQAVRGDLPQHRTHPEVHVAGGPGEQVDQSRGLGERRRQRGHLRGPGPGGRVEGVPAGLDRPSADEHHEHVQRDEARTDEPHAERDRPLRPPGGQGDGEQRRHPHDRDQPGGHERPDEATHVAQGRIPSHPAPVRAIAPSRRADAASIASARIRSSTGAEP